MLPLSRPAHGALTKHKLDLRFWREENETAFEKEFTVESGKKMKLELTAPETK